jgi:hypothetical protein
MPILNGYDACKKMKQFYELFNDNQKLKNTVNADHDQSMSQSWLTDLQTSLADLKSSDPRNEFVGDDEYEYDSEDLQSSDD